jgi:predicted lipoprotein with Yx(FWY)xxD motif
MAELTWHRVVGVDELPEGRVRTVVAAEPLRGMRRLLGIAGVLAAALALAPASAMAARASVTVHDSRYGRILTDGGGRTLYLFTRERSARSRCYGACAAAWPPLIAHGPLVAGRGTRRGLLATTRRRDGSRQVTYRGHPLYYYVGERRAGEILCQDVIEFGGTWLVVSPAGKAVR